MMSRAEDRLSYGCVIFHDEWHCELDWGKLIERLDPIMTTMCGRLWKRGSCPLSRNPDGTNFRGAWWDLPCGVYVCVGPDYGHFYVYDPVRDIAIPLSGGMTIDQLDRALTKIIERAERGQ